MRFHAFAAMVRPFALVLAGVAHMMRLARSQTDSRPRCGRWLHRIDRARALWFAAALLSLPQNEATAIVVDDGATFEFVRLTDDLDENGVVGAAFVVIPGADGSPIVTRVTDFGDLHTFNISFDNLQTADIPSSGACDVIDVIWLGDDEASDHEDTMVGWQAAEALRLRDWQQTGFDGNVPPANESISFQYPELAPRLQRLDIRTRKNGLGIVYGIRTVNRQDFQSVFARGGILGKFNVSTAAENQIIGPQAGIVWIKTLGPFTARLQGLASAGYNHGQMEQTGGVGAELVPGAINRPLFAAPTNFKNELQHDSISPNAEIRADVNFRITKSITFAANWSGVVVDNFFQVDQRVRYFLPDMGFNDPGNQRLFVNHLFCGFEMWL